MVATRSIEECSASEISASEPMATPTTSLASRHAAAGEDRDRRDGGLGAGGLDVGGGHGRRFSRAPVNIKQPSTEAERHSLARANLLRIVPIKSCVRDSRRRQLIAASTACDRDDRYVRAQVFRGRRGLRQNSVCRLRSRRQRKPVATSAPTIHSMARQFATAYRLRFADEGIIGEGCDSTPRLRSRGKRGRGISWPANQRWRKRQADVGARCR